MNLLRVFTTGELAGLLDDMDGNLVQILAAPAFSSQAAEEEGELNILGPFPLPRDEEEARGLIS